MRLGISHLGKSINLDPARVGEAEELRHLIEGFARRIVEGPSHDAVVARATDQGQLRMAAAHQQGHMVRDLLRTEKGREEVSLEVVEREVGDAECERKSFRVGGADQERRSKAGAGGRGHGAEITGCDAGFGKGAPDEGIDGQKMVARGDLGHDAAEACVLLRLRRNQAGENRPGRTHHSHRGLVTAGLDGEDEFAPEGSFGAVRCRCSLAV